MLQGRSYFAELRESLEDELDYREEAARARRYAQAAQGVPGIRVPRAFDELTAEKVLTLELLEGVTLKDFLADLDAHDNAERMHAASLLIAALWGPFLREGVIHGDPHPGNFLLLRDGTMGVLDFGAIKALSLPFVDVNRRLYAAAVRGEPYDAIQLSFDCGFTFKDVEDARPLVEEVVRIVTRPVRSDDFDTAQAGTTRELRNLMMKNALKAGGVHPPKESVLFFRGIGGLAQNLENLKVRGNFRKVYAELLKLAVDPLASVSALG